MNDQRRPSTHDGYEEDTAHETSPPSHHAAPGHGTPATTKTLTDPHTGEPTEGRPDTVGGG